MTAPEVEFVVIGAGIVGSATARCLAMAGRETLLVEQFRVGHKRGSSHGASRIFRLSYDDPTYVEMAMRALQLWRELEQECDRELITTTGGLDVGKEVDDHVDALEKCGAAYELIDGREARRRFPAIELPDAEIVLFQRDAGIARADASLAAFVAGARIHGATLREGVKATSLGIYDDRVEIMTSDETIHARVAVVAAGGWAAGLLDSAGISLPVVPTRETVAYFDLPQDLTVPSIVDWEDPAFYALADPGRGIKAGLHHAGPVTDPADEGAVSGETVARLEARVGAIFPSASAGATGAETCIYTNTSDESFIIERHGPVVIGSACSGHGFKFAPLTGKRLASLALERG